MDHENWFQQARFGLFIHWGIYAVRGFEASWPLVRGEATFDTYMALAEQFNPQHYDPVAWAALAKAAGVRYAVLTTKHHDGYAMYDTKLSNFSAAKSAAGRDLVGPYVEAFRAAGIRVGFYFSLCDWHHPDYPVELTGVMTHLRRPPLGQPPGVPQTMAEAPERWERYRTFLHSQVRELCTNYGKIDLLWFDGHWEHTAEEWHARELVTMIRELQPGIVINDRLADPLLGDYSTPEQFVPVDSPDRPWETCMTINETWGYNPIDRAYKSSSELVATLAEVVAKGGTFLLNVGPTADGEIPPEFASRLRVIGGWLNRNGESVYGARSGVSPGAYYGPSTGSADSLYLHVVGEPIDGVLKVRGVGQRVKQVQVLGTGEPLEFDQHSGSLEQGMLRITLPPRARDPLMTVVKVQY